MHSIVALKVHALLSYPTNRCTCSWKLKFSAFKSRVELNKSGPGKDVCFFLHNNNNNNNNNNSNNNNNNNNEIKINK